MRFTYDPEANAAYIYLTDGFRLGMAAKTYPCDPRQVNGMINLDFDKEGRLIGVEVLDARGKLPPELLLRLEGRRWIDL